MEFMAKRSQSTPPIIAVSENRIRMALCENGINGQNATISLFNLATDPPQVTWRFNHVSKGNITSVSLSADAKVIAVQVTEPVDPKKVRNTKTSAKTAMSQQSTAVSSIAMWKVDTKKFIAAREIESRINQVSINPEDNYLVVAVGEKYLRYLKCAGNALDEVRRLSTSRLNFCLCFALDTDREFASSFVLPPSLTPQLSVAS